MDGRPMYDWHAVREAVAAMVLISRGRLENPTDAERAGQPLWEWVKARVSVEEFEQAVCDVEQMTPEERGMHIRRVDGYDA